MDWTEFIHLLAGLLSVVNPIGVVPIFLSLTAQMSHAERIQTAARTGFALAMVLLVSLICGEPILRFLGIGLPAFRVAGGILLLLMGIAMLRASGDMVSQTAKDQNGSVDQHSVAVVPLAIPLLGGPGAISTTIVYAHNDLSLRHYVLFGGVIVTVAALTWAVLRMAPTISNAMGQTGMNVVTRVMGLLLASIAVDIMATGLNELFPLLASAAAPN